MENKNIQKNINMFFFPFEGEGYAFYIFLDKDFPYLLKNIWYLQVFFTKKCELHCNTPMDIECCTKNVALKTENETQNREQWRHVFSRQLSKITFPISGEDRSNFSEKDEAHDWTYLLVYTEYYCD